MRRFIGCDMERHETGGPGLFVLGQAQTLADRLKEYEGQVQLIYIDPPFGTGDVFQVKLDPEKNVRLVAYSDDLAADAYCAMFRDVLTLCHRLLSPSGSLYLHVDFRMSARLRLMLDEIFGEKNFMNEIVWAYKSGGRSRRHFSRKHDTILFYRKSSYVYFNIDAVGVPRGPERRNHMKRSVDEQGRVCFTIRSAGKTYTYYEDTPVFPTDVWTDIEHLHQKDPERVGYATQKPKALLKRIILASSRPGDIVADLFAGSGTTAAVAAGTGRRFLLCDCSPIAMHVIRKRLLEEGSAMSLLDQDHPFTLTYENPPEAEGMPVAALSRSGGQCCVSIAEYASPQEDAGSLAYCALGEISGGAFLPKAYAFYPRLPVDLKMMDCPAPVLQTVEINGAQAFWQF